MYLKEPIQTQTNVHVCIFYPNILGFYYETKSTGAAAKSLSVEGYV